MAPDIQLLLVVVPSVMSFWAQQIFKAAQEVALPRPRYRRRYPSLAARLSSSLLPNGEPYPSSSRFLYTRLTSTGSSSPSKPIAAYQNPASLHSSSRPRIRTACSACCVPALLRTIKDEAIGRAVAESEASHPNKPKSVTSIIARMQKTPVIERFIKPRSQVVHGAIY
jgi:hypothetical protein